MFDIFSRSILLINSLQLFVASYIISTGSYLPNRVVTNDELGEMFEVVPSSIEKKSGIEERRWADKTEKTSDLAVRALLDSLSRRNLNPEAVSYLLVGTMSPDRFIPGCAPSIQAAAGLRQIPALDIRAGCCNLLYALQLADALLRCSKQGLVAITLAEIQSRYLSFAPEDAYLSMLFGDGAASMIVASEEESGALEILDILLETDGRFVNDLGVASPGTEFESNSLSRPQMNGLGVISAAKRRLTATCREVLSRNELTIADIDWMVPHQANANLLRIIIDDLGFPDERLIKVLSTTGNTSSASMGIALHSLTQRSELKSNDLVLLAGFGTGFTWGAGLCRVV
jgi:3-oxoacyl-[acyl-carrier-protein] synthase III